MNLVWAMLVIAAVTAVAVAAMLLVRRGAPEGSRFADGEPDHRVLLVAGGDLLDGSVLE